VIGLVALLTCGLAITSPTFAALVPEMVSREDLPRASALNQTASAVGMLVGLALAGVLVGRHGARHAAMASRPTTRPLRSWPDWQLVDRLRRVGQAEDPLLMPSCCSMRGRSQTGGGAQRMRGLSGSEGREEIEERRVVVGKVLAGLRADGLEPSNDMLRDVERYAVGQIDAVEFVTRTMDRAGRRSH
jgi:hypothetical protein